MFEEAKQSVDGDELSEEELAQIKATPHYEYDWQHSVGTPIAHPPTTSSNYINSGCLPDSRAFCLNPLL